VTAVIVMAMNSIGSSKPNVWTVPTMKHDDPTDSNGSIVGAFIGGFSLATGIATVVFILIFCNMKRKIDKLEKNSNKSPVQPEESQYTEIELKFNPSYQSVEVKPDKENEVYEAMDSSC
jgi:dsRNA-specific ribonuclease